MARARRLSARGTEGRRVPPLGARLDLRGDAGARPFRAGRIAAGPGVRPDLSAQPGGAQGNRRVSGRGHRLRVLEALLFASPEPVAEEELARRLGEEAEVAPLVRELAAAYAERGVNL